MINLEIKNLQIKIRTTTAKLPVQVKQQMLERVIKEGYGLKGKSKWVSESIERFLLLPEYPELVDIAVEMEEMTGLISISLSDTVMSKLDKAVVEVRQQYPTIEGVRSKVIRASIMQRLLRG